MPYTQPKFLWTLFVFLQKIYNNVNTSLARYILQHSFPFLHPSYIGEI